MNKNIFISLLILLSVLMFAHRIYEHFHKQQFIKKKLLTKIGTLHFCFLFLLYFLNFQKPFQLWIFSFVSLSLFPLMIFIILKFHQYQFQSEFLRFLSSLILRMQMGQSFLSGMESTLSEGDWRQGVLLQRIYQNVVFSPQVKFEKTGPFVGFLQNAIDELTYVHQHQHLAIDRLCNFQKNLQSEFFFRRKSRQVWSYFAYQLGLLSILFWTLFFYNIYQHGFFIFKNSYLLSLFFYFLGVWVVTFLLRSKKWHI